MISETERLQIMDKFKIFFRDEIIKNHKKILKNLKS